MGAILRVVDVDLRRDLAMKVMLQRGERRADERHVARFVEEAQITGQLEHPGIVPVHDLGLDDQGRMFFTMRLVRGRDFEQIIGAGPSRHRRGMDADARASACCSRSARRWPTRTRNT